MIAADRLDVAIQVIADGFGCLVRLTALACRNSWDGAYFELRRQGPLAVVWVRTHELPRGPALITDLPNSHLTGEVRIGT